MKTLPMLRLAGACALATAAMPAADAAKAPAARPSTAKSGAAGKVLPDPALLDGSANPAEKRSEHGMIGDFELPGDENARSGKVGGGQPGQPGGQGGQQPNQQGQQPAITLPPVPLPGGVTMPGANGSGGLPAGAAGGGLPGIPAAQGGGLPNPAGGGAQGGAMPAGSQGGAQGAQGGAQGAAGAAGGDPSGVQVAGLGGDAGAAGAQGAQGAGNAGGKPAPVGIGDSSMRIEPSPGMPQAGPNAQAAGHTQNHDKGTGSGGRGAAGAQSGNRVEKGRATPAGL